MGRRREDDARQIARCKAIRRHIRQIEKNCERDRPGLPPAPAQGGAALGL